MHRSDRLHYAAPKKQTDLGRLIQGTEEFGLENLNGEWDHLDQMHSRPMLPCRAQKGWTAFEGRGFSLLFGGITEMREAETEKLMQAEKGCATTLKVH